MYSCSTYIVAVCDLDLLLTSPNFLLLAENNKIIPVIGCHSKSV